MWSSVSSFAALFWDYPPWALELEPWALLNSHHLLLLSHEDHDNGTIVLYNAVAGFTIELIILVSVCIWEWVVCWASLILGIMLSDTSSTHHTTTAWGHMTNENDLQFVYYLVVVLLLLLVLARSHSTTSSLQTTISTLIMHWCADANTSQSRSAE